MNIIKRICQQYYIKKSISKKFSTDNNMDFKKVSKEFKGLTEIKEMPNYIDIYSDNSILT